MEKPHNWITSDQKAPMTITQPRIRRLMLLPVMAMLFGMLCLAGCGSRTAGPETFPVTGEVTLDGQAVAGANIAFLPSAESTEAVPAQAVTGEDGKFNVTSIFDQGRVSKPGMRPGVYSVEIIQLEQAASGASLNSKPRNLLPEKYSLAASSGLSVTVAPEGERHFMLKLTK